MPSRVFASVFGDVAATSKKDQTTSTSKDHDRKTALDVLQQHIRGISPLDDNLKSAWFEHFYLLRGHDLLDRTINRFRKILDDSFQHVDLSPSTTARSYVLAWLAHSLPSGRLELALSSFLVELGKQLLQIKQSGADLQGDFSIDELFSDLQRLIHGLCDCGLGGDYAARAYAKAFYELLRWVVLENIGTPGTAHWSRAVAQKYITERFTPLVMDMMMPLNMLENGVDESEALRRSAAGRADMSLHAETWISLAAEIIAEVMSKRLYEVIVSGEVETNEILADDLEAITGTAHARDHLAKELHKEVQLRLLNSGSSTVAILDAYVQFIWALRRIDRTGVLLARISSDITQYLRTRDDAVRIVIHSLLEPGEDNTGVALISTEHFSGHVSKLMKQAMAANSVYGSTYYPGKDLKNLAWEPEPIDAVGDYRTTRYRDAMGHMVTIKDKDAFIEELRSILGERLLVSDALKFDQEERLLAMFKTRFEDFPIRECEIMLKDMQESLSWHRYINAKGKKTDPNAPDLEVKIISHSYWPSLRNEDMVLPQPMKKMVDWYSREFQVIKYLRKLDWISSQGRVTVELALEDRTVVEEVTTWQAAVIYSFDDEDDTSTPAPVRRTVSEIETALALDEDLIRAALTFWVGKLVLQEVPGEDDTYAVIESLTTAPTDANAEEQSQGAIVAAAATAAAVAAAQVDTAEVKTSLDLMKENETLYTNFVVNMLTNQGHMPAARMMMMLKMLLPGGFPFEEAEFVEFLEGLAAEGRVERAGGLWMVKKA